MPLSKKACGLAICPQSFYQNIDVCPRATVDGSQLWFRDLTPMVKIFKGQQIKDDMKIGFIEEFIAAVGR